MAEESLIGAYPQAASMVFDDAAHGALTGNPLARLMYLATLAVEPEEAVIVGTHPQASFRVFERHDDIVVCQSAAVIPIIPRNLIVADAEQTIGYRRSPQLIMGIDKQ